MKWWLLPACWWKLREDEAVLTERCQKLSGWKFWGKSLKILNSRKILTEDPTGIETNFLEHQNSICSKPMNEIGQMSFQSLWDMVPKSPNCSESVTASACPVLPKLHHLHPRSLKSLHISSNPFGFPGSTLKTSSMQFWGAVLGHAGKWLRQQYKW